MKRHLNTCYRLVWNHITGAFVVASELARARGKRGGVAVALSLPRSRHSRCWLLASLCTRVKQ